MISGGIFDVTDKESLLVDINSKLSDESTWSNLELSQTLNKEKAHLEKFLNSFHSVDDAINDNLGLLEIAIDESDEESIDEPQFEDESIAEIDHMRKLAGVMSQTPKAKKKENIHKTTPRSIHKRQK